jgi:hypothetical protein
MFDPKVLLSYKKAALTSRLSAILGLHRSFDDLNDLTGLRIDEYGLIVHDSIAVGILKTHGLGNRIESDAGREGLADGHLLGDADRRTALSNHIATDTGRFLGSEGAADRSAGNTADNGPNRPTHNSACHRAACCAPLAGGKGKSQNCQEGSRT